MFLSIEGIFATRLVLSPVSPGDPKATLLSQLPENLWTRFTYCIKSLHYIFPTPYLPFLFPLQPDLTSIVHRMGNTSHSKTTAFRSGFAQQQIKEAAPFLSKNSLPFIQAERFPVFKPGRTHNYHAPQYRVFLGEGQPSAKLLNGQQSSYKRTGFMVVLPTEERTPEKWVEAGGKVRRPPCSGTRIHAVYPFL